MLLSDHIMELCIVLAATDSATTRPVFCSVLYFALPYIVLHCLALFYTVLHCFAQFCTVLHSFVLPYTVCTTLLYRVTHSTLFCCQHKTLIGTHRFPKFSLALFSDKLSPWDIEDN